MMHSFLPPHLVEHLARTSQTFRKSLAADSGMRAMRRVSPAVTSKDIVIHDAKNSMVLPGDLIEGVGPVEAQRVRGHAIAIQGMQDVLPKTAIPVSVVNYGDVYPNAFFDGTYLVFGEGDGEIFGDFSKPLEVCAHEFAHKVIDAGPKLEYVGQPGALNEHIADVIGVCAKLKSTKGKGDWRIGSDLFLKKGPALRDMSKPGTAYNDDILGKDPQVGHMDDFVDTFLDNGGVHINSGIPNKAFTVFADALGDNPWETPLKVWIEAMAKSSKKTTFAEFATFTYDAAADRDADVRLCVAKGWKDVGVNTSS